MFKLQWSRRSGDVSVRRGVKTSINRKELYHCNNQLSFNKFVIKPFISALALSKATKKFIGEVCELGSGKATNGGGKPAGV
jgi:hypothetical protein